MARTTGAARAVEGGTRSLVSLYPARLAGHGLVLDPWSEAVDEWRRRSDTLPGAVVREFVGRPDKAEERGR